LALHILGDYRIDEHARRLWRGDGSEVDLPGRAFDVLLVLLRHRGRVVARSELLDAVWYDSDVTDAALSQALSLARRALGSDGHRLIRTVPGRGYCIDSLVEPERRAAAEGAPDPAPVVRSDTLPDAAVAGTVIGATATDATVAGAAAADAVPAAAAPDADADAALPAAPAAPAAPHFRPTAARL